MHTKSDDNFKYNRVLLERLNNIIPKIVDAFGPQEIIMYGSYARGDNDIYSDIDLIIIVDDINMRFQDRSIKVIRSVSEEDEENEIPINPIVYTTQEFKNMLENKESFLVLALQESVLLWKRNENSNLETQLESAELQSEFKKYLPED